MLVMGLMVTTDMAVKDTNFHESLRSIHESLRPMRRKVLGLDMEGSGIAFSLDDAKVPFFCMMGISDAVDQKEENNHMEEHERRADLKARKVFRHCAIFNVMRFLVALLDSESFHRV